jgi:hypothetical protein
MRCTECNCPVPCDVYNYSSDHFGFPLCRDHQKWALQHTATDHAISLYFALKECGVSAELEKHDGFKSIDIAVVKAKVNIEVDGSHHNRDSRQALADLRRTFHSFKKGYFTLRIPNSLIESRFDETVEMVLDIVEVGERKNSKRKFSNLKSFR